MLNEASYAINKCIYHIIVYTDKLPVSKINLVVH